MHCLSTLFFIPSLEHAVQLCEVGCAATDLTLKISLALELNIVRSIVAKADLSISSWCYDSVERRERAKVMCGLMEKLEAHLCDLVEGKWFI